MTSKPAPTNSDRDSDTTSEHESPMPLHQVSADSVEQEMPIESDAPESTEPVDERIEIPEPDAENITVLTDKLPNTPILPWNRYDSPWEETDVNQETKADQPSDETMIEHYHTQQHENEEDSAVKESKSDAVE